MSDRVWNCLNCTPQAACSGGSCGLPVPVSYLLRFLCSKELGAGVSEDTLRQQAAISRKRGRAGGCAPCPTPSRHAAASSPADSVSEVAAGQSTTAGDDTIPAPHSAPLPHVPCCAASQREADSTEPAEPRIKGTTLTGACHLPDTPATVENADDAFFVAHNNTQSEITANTVENAACSGITPLQHAGDLPDAKQEPRRKGAERMKEAVSYTHLTLPTILLV